MPDDIAIEYDVDTRMFAILVYDRVMACWDIAGYAYCYAAAEETAKELRASIEEAQYEAAGTPEH